MINKLIEYSIIAVVLFFAGWWFKGEICKRCNAPLIEAHTKAIAKQQAQNELAVNSLWKLKQQTQIVYVDRIDQIEKYAKNLPNTCPADADFVRMLNANQR